MNEIDPYEAANSFSIIMAISDTFSESLVIFTGGLIYHLCLNDILVNIDEGSNLLEYLLRLDDETIRMGMQHYAFILAKK